MLFNGASLSRSLDLAGFERIQALPAVGVVEQMFAKSAAMRLGRIAEKDVTPLPDDARNEASRAVRQARALIRRHAEKSEFITLAAYRPRTEV